jgi:tRNA1(Val) A37 N6-methylase TrmN6
MGKYDKEIEILNQYSIYEDGRINEIYELAQTLSFKIMEYRKMMKNQQKATSLIINKLKKDGEEKEGVNTQND